MLVLYMLYLVGKYLCIMPKTYWIAWWIAFIIKIVTFLSGVYQAGKESE